LQLVARRTLIIGVAVWPQARQSSAFKLGFVQLASATRLCPCRLGPFLTRSPTSRLCLLAVWFQIGGLSLRALQLRLLHPGFIAGPLVGRSAAVLGAVFPLPFARRQRLPFTLEQAVLVFRALFLG